MSNAVKIANESRHPSGKNTRLEELTDWLRDYASRRINSRLMDERRMLSPNVILEFGNKGILGALIPREFGGLGLTFTEFGRLIGQVTAIDFTLGQFVSLNNLLGSYPIFSFAKNNLKEEILPLLASGRMLASFGLTEKAAGSNPLAMEATASRVNPNQWTLNGTKIWVGSASWAGIVTVFAKDIDQSGQKGGISAFSVKTDKKGLRFGPEALTLGLRGAVQCPVILENVVVDQEELLGQAGQGMDVASEALNRGRFGIAAGSLGGIKRCLQIVGRYAQIRNVSSGLYIKNPVLLLGIQNLMSMTSALEKVVNKVGALLDANKPVPPFLFLTCKLTGPEFLWRAADFMVQTLGGRGYIESNLAPQLLRDARITRIFEGPTEALEVYGGSLLLSEKNRFSDLKKCLSHSVGDAPSLLDRVSLDIEKLRDESKMLSAKDACLSINNRIMLQSYVGKLGALATLWAISLDDSRSEPRQSRTIQWLSNEYLSVLTRARIDLTDSGRMASAEALDNLRQYGDQIGDFDQTLPGEEHDLDELLRQTPITKK